jgi:hypothetical protein
MLDMQTAIRRAIASGSLVGLGIAAVTALAGKRETGSAAAPLNATSHIVWGDQAAVQDAPSLKYTLTGFVLNHASAIFWAAVYEKFFGADSAQSSRASLLRPLIGGAVVSAGAYVTDYYLVPKRLTPGFEKRLSGKSLATVYALLAIGLAASELIARSSRRPS